MESGRAEALTGLHDLDESRLSAWRSVREVAKTVVDQVSVELEASTGLPLDWFEVLLHIYEAGQGRLQQRDLDAHSYLSQSAISRLVSRMQQMGLLRREPDENDRRNVYVVLTEAGRDALFRATPVYNAAVQNRFGAWLSNRETSVLNVCLQKVLKASGNDNRGRADLDHMVTFGQTILSVVSDSVAVSDAFDVRATLEAAVTVDATRHITPAGINALREAVVKMSALVDQPSEFFKSDWNLHRTIASYCHNTLLRGLYTALIDMVEARMIRFVPTADLTDYINERLSVHARIVDAIASGDKELARAAAEAHNSAESGNTMTARALRKGTPLS